MLTGYNWLRTLSILEVSVYFLWRHEQKDHLPDGELEIHLLKLKQFSQVFVAFGRCAHAVVPAMRHVVHSRSKIK